MRSTGHLLTVRTSQRPGSGAPKAEHASRDFYDVWLPDLAPPEGLVRSVLNALLQEHEAKLA